MLQVATSSLWTWIKNKRKSISCLSLMGILGFYNPGDISGCRMLTDHLHFVVLHKRHKSAILCDFCFITGFLNDDKNDAS